MHNEKVSFRSKIALLCLMVKFLDCSDYFLKQIFLYVAAFPTTVGVALILLSFIIQFLFLKRLLDILQIFRAFSIRRICIRGLILLMLVGIVLNLYINYGLSPGLLFLLYDYLDKDMYTSPFKIFKQSWQLMELGIKWRQLLLDLSFIGWFAAHHLDVRTPRDLCIPLLLDLSSAVL